MRHLAEVDTHSTVIMVQVENETGVLGDSRNRSKKTEEAFKKPVPQELMRHLSGPNLHSRFKRRFSNIPSDGEHSWEDVFGAGVPANEAFMAHHISTFVGCVAAAGKKQHPIPMYANAWLNFDEPRELELTGLPIVVGGGKVAAVYPSGGPCPHMIDIWRLNAPEIDFVAPDLYVHNYELIFQYYSEQGNPLFIPEMRRDSWPWLPCLF